MAAQLTKADFTLTEELDALVAGDNTVEIIGYVDHVEGTKSIGNPSKLLYKCTINNADGRRIRFLKWEDTVAAYEHVIKSRDIIRIRRGRITAVNPRYFKADNDIIPFEVNTYPLTTIEISGKFSISGAQDEPLKYVPVQLKYIADATGNVCVQGYIKGTFEKQMSGYSTHGTGAITDGVYKLRVHIGNLETDSNLHEGVLVEIKGDLKEDGFGNNFLQVDDMIDIKIIEGELMSPTELRKGYRPPSRVHQIQFVWSKLK